MRVLVACEFSGVVRDAFRAEGHDAWSCDLLPSATPGGQHLEGDVRWWLDGSNAPAGGWDMMIAHPPCTYLAASGLHWNARVPGRALLTESALAFVLELLNAPIPRVCVENPIGIISTRIRRPDQIVQPWHFGDDASKATCLWLRNLPPLLPDGMLPGDNRTRRANQMPDGQNRLGETRDRWKLRSITYPGIARAMARQWGSL